MTNRSAIKSAAPRRPRAATKVTEITAGKGPGFVDVDGTDTRNAFVERRKLLAKAPGHVRQQALDMCKFDQLTDPDELGRMTPCSMGSKIESLSRYLLFRTIQRASWSVYRLQFEPPEELDEQNRHCAIAVEKHFRETLAKVFHGQGRPGVFDRKRFERAFTSYIAGEIAMRRLFPKWPAKWGEHGVPDGPMAFCFAESALLFLRLRLSPRFWRELVPLFVCGAQFFAALYWDQSQRRRSAYSWQHQKVCTTGAVVLAGLAQRQRGLTISELAAEFSQIVGIALGEDSAISYPTPRCKELR
jgi:hypothetical protein